jgi:hypothetical protein
VSGSTSSYRGPEIRCQLRASCPGGPAILSGILAAREVRDLLTGPSEPISLPGRRTRASRAAAVPVCWPTRSNSRHSFRSPAWGPWATSAVGRHRACFRRSVSCPATPVHQRRRTVRRPGGNGRTGYVQHPAREHGWPPAPVMPASAGAPRIKAERDPIGPASSGGPRNSSPLTCTPSAPGPRRKPRQAVEHRVQRRPCSRPADLASVPAGPGPAMARLSSPSSAMSSRRRRFPVSLAVHWWYGPCAAGVRVPDPNQRETSPIVSRTWRASWTPTRLRRYRGDPAIARVAQRSLAVVC